MRDIIIKKVSPRTDLVSWEATYTTQLLTYAVFMAHCIHQKTGIHLFPAPNLISEDIVQLGLFRLPQIKNTNVMSFLSGTIPGNAFTILLIQSEFARELQQKAKLIKTEEIITPFFELKS